MNQRVILADDHKIVREGLRSMLENQLHMKVIAEAEDGLMAVRLVEEHKPDLVIMDISMPGLNGIEATRKIKSTNPDVKIIALSMHSDKRYIAEFLKVGATGYLLKNCGFEELSQAVNNVLAGKTYISPSVAGTVIQDYVSHLNGEVNNNTASNLTPREREILQLLAEGKSIKDIASRLNTSSKTIDNHKTHIMEKLGLNSIAELTKYAVREGLTSIE